MRQGLSHRTLCPLGRALDRARRRRRPARCGADQEQLKCQLGCGPGLRVRGRVRAHRAVCEEVPQPNFMGWIQTYGGGLQATVPQRGRESRDTGTCQTRVS